MANIRIRPDGAGGFEVVPGHPLVQADENITWTNQTARRVVLILPRWAQTVFQPDLFVEEIPPGGTATRKVDGTPSPKGGHLYKVYVKVDNAYAAGGSDPGIDV